MKKMTAIMLTAMATLLASVLVVGAVDLVEIRGQVATGDFTWTPQNFAGFYYDIDDDIGTESLTTTITEGNKLSGDAPYGVKYVSTAQQKEFEFEDWGTYNVIGFMAKKYFAGYVQDANTSPENQVLFSQSTDENVLSDEQLLEILVDDDEEMTVTSGTPLKLQNGYELAIRSIDIDGNKVFLELTKDGQSVDSKVISPSADNANMADKTYYYKKDVGDSKGVVIVAVHFKNAFRGADQDLATIDGEWQLSDVSTEVKDDTEYDKMTITSSTPTTITMENKDNAITLSKNKDITLMPGVGIKTADNETLRYYIYTPVTIEGAAEVPAETVTPVEEPVEVVTPAENVTPAEAPVENVTPAETPAETPAKNETPAKPSSGLPGFEATFAVAGLLAVAYLVIGRKQ
jgi:S-layer protein (TIGR01567 family)